MLPEAIRVALEKEIGRKPLQVVPMSGGNASGAHKVTFERGPALFVKWQSETAEALRAEREGLDILAAADSGLVVPRCLAYDFRVGRGGYIAIEWLKSSPAGTAHWTALGEGLASLHRVVAERYGFGSNNFIGLLPQQNEWSQSWPDFFASSRLNPQVAIAKDRQRWRAEWRKPYEQLLSRLKEILPKDPGASLVHGDLWAGNVMATDRGPAIFDPAAYYGHREADVAMTRLFGGFDSAFYDAYNQVWPIEGGYENRTEVYNLYHLLNHMNIFGGSYADGVDRVLRRFV